MNVPITSASESSAAYWDAVFKVLSNYRCRIALSRLAEADVPLALADLARDVAVETVPADQEPSDVDVESHYLGLYHSWVPKLVDAGFVVHDPETDTIELSGAGSDLKLCLAAVGKIERPT